MSDVAADPSLIGRALPPPAARMPDPDVLFRRRADRFDALAADHPLGPYLSFLAGVARAQDAIVPRLPAVAAPDAESLARAREHAMPPLPRQGVADDPVLLDTLDAFFEAAAAGPMPAEAAAALETIRHASPAARREAVADVLGERIPVESLAGYAFVDAALQVHYARWAATLDARSLPALASGVCPACGGPPVSSVVVGWPGAENARYCVCALCATYWNAVRVKCIVCEATGGIGLRSIEGGDESVKAECCDTCHSYVKVLYQVRHPALEALADDVASFGLDLLLRESPYRRAAYNPFLLGT